MKKPSQKNLLTGILALLFALLLFFNANTKGNSVTLQTAMSQIYDEMIYNVPIQLEYDKDKYFVSGYQEKVNVQLSSANRVQLDLESNEDTRNFQIVADLRNIKPGTSVVKLRATGLNPAVTSGIEPESITVTIEKKETKSFKVEVPIPGQIEAEGYTVEDVSTKPQSVEITTGDETMKAIDKVIAPVTYSSQVTDSIKQVVNVQALNKQGQVLSIENPAPQVEVNLSLALPKKEVGLQISPTGSTPAGISYFTFSLAKQKVEIKGPNSILDSIDTIELPIDISKIHEKTKQKVKVPTTGQYTAKPEEVEVEITPVFVEKNSSSLKENKTTTTKSKDSNEQTTDSK